MTANLDLFTPGNVAQFSPCAKYRYLLTREGLGGTGTCLFIMLNPSTADAMVDDATIRRCSGFAQRWGYARLEVANIYAYRSTDPRALRDLADPVGPENDQYIAEAVARADKVVCAWGAHPARNPFSKRYHDFTMTLLVLQLAVFEVWISPGDLTDPEISILAAHVERAAGLWNDIEDPRAEIVLMGTDDEPVESSPLSTIRVVRTAVDMPDHLWGHLGSTEPHTDAYGRPVGGDIWLNALEFDWDWGNPPGVSGSFRLDAVLAHELGHLIGLQHVSCSGAIMAEGIGPGQWRPVTRCDLVRYRSVWGGQYPGPREESGCGEDLDSGWMAPVWVIAGWRRRTTRPRPKSNGVPSLRSGRFRPWSANA